MAYHTFYVDRVNGTDTNPTTLSNATASNPSGTITRINFTGHGLTTGQTVILNSFSTWLNTSWTVTVVDANNFDLDGAVWQTTADNTGNVQRLNGYSWATAYRTMGFSVGTAYSKTVEVRVAKSPDPVSIGNGTWTNKSPTVTLATAQTGTIDNCDGTWTAANTATVTRVTSSMKQGTAFNRITAPAAPAINTKYGYFATGTLDLSAYQRISFWIQNNTAIATNTRWVIKLCSDTTGDTVVDEFVIPAIPATGNWFPMTITKTGGGNLGNAIQSIALYSGTVAPAGSQQISLDNIFATTTDGICLNSLVSKNSSATYDHSKEPWYPVRNISGTTLNLDPYSNHSGTSYDQYTYYAPGASPETVTTYYRNPVEYKETASLNTKMTVFSPNTALVTYSGGWNTTNTTRDGMTYYDGVHGWGYVFGSNSSTFSSPATYNEVTDFIFSRHNGVLNNSTTSELRYTTFRRIYITSTNNIGIETGSVTRDITLENITLNNTQHGALLYGVNSNYTNIKLYSNINSIRIRLYFSKLENLYVANFLIQQGFGVSFENSPILTDNTEINNVTIDANAIQKTDTSSAAVIAYGAVKISNMTVKNAGTAFSGGNGQYSVFKVNTLTLSSNNYSVALSYGTEFYLNNVTTTDTTQFRQISRVSGTAFSPQSAFFSNINGNPDDNKGYLSLYNQGISGTGAAPDISFLSQTSVRKSASGIAWQINILNAWVIEDEPYNFKIATVAVNANSLVTVKAWVKKSHATDIGAKLFIPRAQLPGMTNNVVSTKSNDTNWEELTVSFTPTSKGVVDVFLQSYWLANLADESVYVDDVTVTQA